MFKEEFSFPTEGTRLSAMTLFAPEPWQLESSAKIFKLLLFCTVLTYLVSLVRLIKDMNIAVVNISHPARHVHTLFQNRVSIAA